MRSSKQRLLRACTGNTLANAGRIDMQSTTPTVRMMAFRGRLVAEIDAVWEYYCARGYNIQVRNQSYSIVNMPGSEIYPPAPAYSSLSMFQSIGICAISEFGDLASCGPPGPVHTRSASRWATQLATVHCRCRLGAVNSNSDSKAAW